MPPAQESLVLRTEGLIMRYGEKKWAKEEAEDAADSLTDVSAQQQKATREKGKPRSGRSHRGANERRSGTSRNRTGDTRIFSPMLYQLS